MSNSMKGMQVARGMFRSLCLALLLFSCCALSAQNNNEEHRVRNIVLVHGAWADGSGWKGVYDVLLKDGYNVSIVRELETSLISTPHSLHEYFAADLSAEQAAFMARSQVLNKADNFRIVITAPAWRSIEVPGASHAVYVSRPKEVAAVIEEAASHARR
jgi:hypothetical protein